MSGLDFFIIMKWTQKTCYSLHWISPLCNHLSQICLPLKEMQLSVNSKYIWKDILHYLLKRGWRFPLSLVWHLAAIAVMAASGTSSLASPLSYDGCSKFTHHQEHKEITQNNSSFIYIYIQNTNLHNKIKW